MGPSKSFVFADEIADFLYSLLIHESKEERDRRQWVCHRCLTEANLLFFSTPVAGTGKGVLFSAAHGALQCIGILSSGSRASISVDDDEVLYRYDECVDGECH